MLLVSCGADFDEKLKRGVGHAQDVVRNVLLLSRRCGMPVHQAYKLLEVEVGCSGASSWFHRGCISRKRCRTHTSYLLLLQNWVVCHVRRRRRETPEMERICKVRNRSFRLKFWRYGAGRRAFRLRSLCSFLAQKAP